MKKTLSIILVIFCLFGLVACGSGKKNDNHTTKENTTTTDTTNNPNQPTDATVGDSVKKTKWNIKLLDAKVYEQVGEGIFKYTAEEGKMFLVLYFELENITDASQSLVTTWVSSKVNSASQQYKMLQTKIDGYSFLSGNVAAGQKLQGYLAWEVSKQNFSVLSLTYSELIQGSNPLTYDNYTFTVKSENISNLSE